VAYNSILTGHKGLPLDSQGSAERRGAVALDWDGALRQGFLVTDWSRFIALRGQFDMTCAHLIDRELQAYYSGKLPYAHIVKSIPEIYAKGLTGQPVYEHNLAANEFILSDGFLDAISPVASYIFDTVNGLDGVSAYIISGGPRSVLAAFAQEVGIEDVYAMEVVADEGIYTGILKDNPASLARKKELVSRLQERASLILAVGDSESDKPMLDAAQFRITFGHHLANAWNADPFTLTLHHNVDDSDLVALSDFLLRVSKTWTG
jgi:HAD superfamily phosphoserine phosphatase-like hydrolase